MAAAFGKNSSFVVGDRTNCPCLLPWATENFLSTKRHYIAVKCTPHHLEKVALKTIIIIIINIGYDVRLIIIFLIATLLLMKAVCFMKLLRSKVEILFFLSFVSYALLMI